MLTSLAFLHGYIVKLLHASSLKFIKVLVGYLTSIVFRFLWIALLSQTLLSSGKATKPAIGRHGFGFPLGVQIFSEYMHDFYY